MSEQQLFYKNVQAVSRSAHKDLSIRQAPDFSFAKGVNSVPIVAAEFYSASIEYTIVFIGNESGVLPAVILGVKSDQNLYVDQENGWKAEYVPAFVRRYPFIFSTGAGESNQLALCIDQDYYGCNTSGDGERLFQESGENSEYLKTIMNFMEDYQQQFELTKSFCQKLVDLNLLETMSARYKGEDGSEKTLSGFKGIDRAKLKALPQEKVFEIFNSGELELIYMHLNSIRHFKSNIARQM